MLGLAFLALVSLHVLAPWIVLSKVLHVVITRRLSFSRRPHAVATEAVVWMVFGAVWAHAVAVLSSFSLQAEDVCVRYRPHLGPDVYRTGGGPFEFPVRERCVWAEESVVVTPTWPAVVTVLFLAAALVTAGVLVVRVRRDAGRPRR